MAINIGINSGWPANVISNFAATPFVIDGVSCASAEGGIQAPKFPNPEMQRHVCSLVGRAAKFAGKKAAKRIRRQQKVWWQGQEFGFRSKEHFALIERMLRAKFTQCERAKELFLQRAGRHSCMTWDIPSRHSLRCRRANLSACW